MIYGKFRASYFHTIQLSFGTSLAHARDMKRLLAHRNLESIEGAWMDPPGFAHISPRFTVNNFAEGEVSMSMRKGLAKVLVMFMFLAIFVCGQQTFAQSSNTPAATPVQEDDTNLDTQLFLLVATNQDVDDAKLPAALEPVIKQLRASLPFKNYRLAATLINRVKNDGRLNLKWIGGPLVPSGAVSTTTPSFNEFRVNNVKLVGDSKRTVRMEGFGFGVRIPIITQSVAGNGPPGPIINYESTGLNTDISMDEGQPVVVGTLNIGPSGDAIILVMSAKATKQ